VSCLSLSGSCFGPLQKLAQRSLERERSCEH
jgi:hypothetical protein